MHSNLKSIRPFIGALDFEESRKFYLELGFEETVLFPNMNLLTSQHISFYLQRAYIKDWIDNTMIFLEVVDVAEMHDELLSKNLTQIFPSVRISSIKSEPWGSEFFVHDPSGILWHFGQFS